jgi:serine/threonine protein kinase
MTLDAATAAEFRVRFASRFAHLRAAFEEVERLPEAERAAAIGRWCGDDLALAADLQALLAAAERVASPLDVPLVRLPPPAEAPRETVPGFRLLREIGRGGSSTVYLAEQQGEGFMRRVALKVLDRGPEVPLARRFQAEQNILAALEHPGIARLYDAGIAPSGRPYLAMELVEGENLLDSCRRRLLPLRARLELFLAVLEAVAYAHEAGVVHRDLKPANILVSERGEPKLLDFGIARLRLGEPDEPAGDAPETTHTLHRAMTLAYASPEQVSGAAIDARSDLYSLAVVLYELLTERRPYRLSDTSHPTLERAIREQEPERPSSAVTGAEEPRDSSGRKGGTTDAPWSDRARLRRALRGDLDAILLKALRKEPAARYATVADLANDLRRHLEGIPVLARRGSLLYRMGRIARRRRGLLAQGGLALLLAGSVGIWISATQGSRRVSLLDERPGSSPWLAEPVRASAAESYRKALAARARSEGAEAVRWMRAAVGSDPRNPLLRAALADVLVLTDRSSEAKVEAGRALGSAGDLPRESRLLVESVALRTEGRRADEAKVLRSLWLLRPGNPEIGLLFGWSLSRAGETAEARNVARQLLALPRPAAGDLRFSLLELGVLDAQGRMQELLERSDPVLAEVRRRGLGTMVARVLLYQSDAHDGLGDPAQTRALALEAQGLFRLRGEVGGVARAHHMLCLASVREGLHQQVERECGETLRLNRSLGNPSGVSKALNILGASRRHRGLLAEARQAFTEALAAGQGLGDRLNESRFLYNIANVDLELGRLPEAEAGFRRVIPVKREIHDQRGLLLSLQTLAQILMKRGVLREVEPLVAEAESVVRELGGAREKGLILWTRGDLADLMGDRKRAFAAWQEAIGIYERVGEADSIAELRYVLADHAEPLTAAGCRTLERMARELERVEDEDTVSAGLSAARCWCEVGSPQRAGPWLERAAAHPIVARSAPARLDLVLSRAEHALATGRWGEAESFLAEADRESRRLSYGAEVLGVRLLELRLARARGDHPERVRTLAEELARDAKSAGFGAIARRAEALRLRSGPSPAAERSRSRP